MGRVSVGKVTLAAAVVVVLTGCASSSTVPTSTSTSTSRDRPSATVGTESGADSFDDLDPADAAFVAQLRAAGLAPSSASFPDAVYVTDANAVCQILALGEAPSIVKTDLGNMRDNRVTAYGINTEQAEQVIVLSAETYCPAMVPTVMTALG